MSNIYSLIIKNYKTKTIYYQYMTGFFNFNSVSISYARQFLLVCLVLILMLGVAVGQISKIVDMKLGKSGQPHDIVVFTNATIRVQGDKLTFTQCNTYTYQLNYTPTKPGTVYKVPTTLTLLTPIPLKTSCQLGDDMKYLDIFNKTRQSQLYYWQLFDQNDKQLIKFHSEYYSGQYRWGVSKQGVIGVFKEAWENMEFPARLINQRNDKFDLISCNDYYMQIEAREDLTIDFTLIFKKDKNRCQVDHPLNMLLSAKRYKTAHAASDLLLYNAKNQFIGRFQVNTW